MKSERELELECEIIATKDNIKDLKESLKAYSDITIMNSTYNSCNPVYSKFEYEIQCLENDLVNLVDAWGEL